ncbi:SusD/RagB family nutrient-binding outer membrane lipoprotein [Fodinibius salsisoli]|uniref:SusD/RagB family nutrient-binding outer membrane lipoprotein n=1 Tax=Fodinibius salsisoli TaxID=2820877 RepID=A0ABT3PRQ4_9BACT|nr:SusD/RagB family nutrient-binding outer membrane lipoprotein [Fodinibius salsisoli]MCW9708548.1 SusD/RagB family nutrient-binding outer membrane lipoprotein [Fodinibius salsisoli]
MKNSKKITFYLIITLCVGIIGCSDYLDVNTDPNNPTEAPLTGLMTSTTFETSQNMYSLGSTTSYYVQYLASPNQASSTDIQDDVAYDDTWFRFYDVMTDLAVLRQDAAEQGATEYLGVAKILTALNLATVVDAWGDVPYSEAFFVETLTPAYDSQEALYDTVFTMLDEGIADLEQGNSTISLGDDDFIYQGDTAKWISFAHMLKARYLNHLSKQEVYAPSEILAELDQGFTGNSEDAQVDYFQEEFNPWANVAIDNSNLLLGGWLSEQIIKHLDGTLYGVFDPRMETFTDTNDNGEYIGTRNGAGRGDAPEQGARSVLTTNTFYASETAPILIATYAEQKFIEAEAAFRSNQLTRAYEAYLAGIEAHMNKVGVSESAKNDYSTDPAVAVGVNGLTLDQIFKEKYTAMYLHPEAWVDARRYDYQYEDMEVPANLNPALNGQFIRRLSYPDSETQRNSENVPDITLLDRIWWDQE